MRFELDGGFEGAQQVGLTDGERGALAASRQHDRKTSAIEGMIEAADGSHIACVIEDHSAGGAFIQVASPEVVPMRCELFIASKEISLACDVRHRGRAGVGVQFIGGDVERFAQAFGNQPQPAVSEAARAARRHGLNALIIALSTIAEFRGAGFRAQRLMDGALVVLSGQQPIGSWRCEHGRYSWRDAIAGHELFATNDLRSACRATLEAALASLNDRRRHA